MKVLFCCAVAAMCAAGPLLAQTSSATPAFAEQMRQLEHRRLEALVAGDRAAADRLTAEDYHLISPFGTIDDKAARAEVAGRSFLRVADPRADRRPPGRSRWGDLALPDHCRRQAPRGAARSALLAHGLL